MIRIESPDVGRNCAGLSRRSFLQAGVLGLGGLALPDLLRMRAASASTGPPSRNTAVILIWLDGGPPQMETYDPKPDAPAEYRGAYGAIETSVSGIRICELLPAQAKLAHRMAFVRAVHHDNGDHFAAAHWMLTGRFGSNAADLQQRYPSVGSFTARVRGPNRPDLPAYVGLPAAESVYLFPGYQGAAYLGAAYNPFQVDMEQKYLGATSKTKIGTPSLFRNQSDHPRLTRRETLLQRVDNLAREVDRDGSIASLDQYTQQAFNLLLSSSVREAFDLDAEPKTVADRYGDSPWCRYALMARRLVERGVTFVTVDMPHWDLHDNIAAEVKPRCAAMDRAVSTLIQDLDERGMLDHVLVVVMGEFGRTPKLNNGLPQATGVAGRDHWGQSMSVMMAGGGLRMGQAVGATDARGEFPHDRPYRPEDVLATIYTVLGIDPRQEFHDREGRPIPILPATAVPIRELV